MQFYSQTLDDIPKEFLSHQKSPGGADCRTAACASPKTEDLAFILAVLLFIQDQPFFTGSD